MHIAGYAAFLKGLAAAEIVPARTAVAARAALGLFATPPDGMAEIPVQIRGGVVYAAQFALMRVPVLEKLVSGPLH